MNLHTIFVLLCCTAMVVTASNLSASDFTPDQLKQLVRTKYFVENINELEREGHISTILATKKRDEYKQDLLKTFNDVSSDKVDQLLHLKEVEAYVNKVIEGSDEQNSILSRLVGFLSFIDLIWVIAVLIIVAAVGSLFAIYVVPLIISLPIIVIEIFIYLVLTGLVLLGKQCSPSTGIFVALPGLLGFPAAFGFTLSTHFSSGSNAEAGVKLILAISTILYGLVAMWYDSTLFGLLTVATFESLLGFFVAALPFATVVGFKSKHVIGQGMTCSLIILLLYSFTKIGRFPLGPFHVFEKGALWIGSFVYFIGCLIISNKYFSWDNYGTTFDNYVRSNILAFGSSLLATLAGGMFYDSIGNLQGIGGTFLVLLLMEKYIELPWKNTTAIWGLLGFGVILYVTSWFIKTHPQYFISTGMIYE